jgi:hypothetical protein
MSLEKLRQIADERTRDIQMHEILLARITGAIGEQAQEMNRQAERRVKALRYTFISCACGVVLIAGILGAMAGLDHLKTARFFNTGANEQALTTDMHDIVNLANGEQGETLRGKVSDCLDGRQVPYPIEWVGVFSQEGVAEAQCEIGFGFVNAEGEWLVYPDFSQVSQVLDGAATGQRAGREVTLLFEPGQMAKEKE